MIEYVKYINGVWVVKLSNNSDGNFISEVFTPAEITETNDKQSSLLEIKFWESPRIFQIDKANEKSIEYVKILENARMNETPLEVVYELNSYEIEIISNLNQEWNVDYYKDKEEEESKVKLEKELIDVIENEKKLTEIWDFIVRQNCNNTYDVDVCIPFYYKRDGCYARAHKMRQIIEDTYGYQTLKVFSYDSETPGNNSRYKTLAVRDENSCIFWWYHVAPLIKCQIHNEIKEFILDPSLSNELLTLDQWLQLQENLSCSRRAKVGSYEKKPSYIYYPSGRRDDYYTKTNRTLRRYRKTKI